MLTLTRRGFASMIGAGVGAASTLRFRSVYGQSRPEVVVAVQDLPPILAPGNDTSDVGVRITYNLFDKLIEPDFHQNMALRPGLAESWTINDDYTQIEFVLRDGVTFHNGDPMTAEDVAFTFSPERMEGEGPRRFNQYFSGIADSEVVDDRTVRITFAAPDPILEQRFSMWSGEIINRRAYQDAPDYESWGRAPVGTGPFRLASGVGPDRVVLEAFDDYFDGRPMVERITFVEVPEVAARIAGLAAGDYDIAVAIPPDQTGTVEGLGDAVIVGGPSAQIRMLVFNQGEAADPIMRDVHFRRALTLAIDRQLIVETIFNDRTVVPAGAQLPTFGELYVDRQTVTYDPERAISELAQSGYDGSDIFYPILPNYFVNEVSTAEILLEMWRAVGINVELAIQENWGQITRGRHSIRNLSATMLWQDPSVALWRLFKPSVIEGRGWAWNNDEFVQHGQVMEVNPDPEARRQAFARMADIWEIEDPVGAVLFEEVALYGIRDTLDWTPYSLPYMDFGPRNITS